MTLTPLCGGGPGLLTPETLLYQDLFQQLFKIDLVPVRAISRIGRADGNTVAAALAKGLIHNGMAAAHGVLLKSDGLIGAGL